MKLARVLVVALVTLAPTAALAKPPLQGTFEVTKVRDKSGKEAVLADLATGTTLWARMAFTFDGDHLTVSYATLERAKRTLGCVGSVTIDVAWSKTGFTVPMQISSNGSVREFSKLTADDDDSHEAHCGVMLPKGTYTVTAGAAPRIEIDGLGTFFLAPSDEGDTIAWRKHVK